jgi:hypothetical protein
MRYQLRGVDVVKTPFLPLCSSKGADGTAQMFSFQSPVLSIIRDCNDRISPVGGLRGFNLVESLGGRVKPDHEENMLITLFGRPKV